MSRVRGKWDKTPKLERIRTAERVNISIERGGHDAPAARQYTRKYEKGANHGRMFYCNILSTNNLLRNRVRETASACRARHGFQLFVHLIRIVVKIWPQPAFDCPQLHPFAQVIIQ